MTFGNFLRSVCGVTSATCPYQPEANRFFPFFFTPLFTWFVHLSLFLQNCASANEIENYRSKLLVDDWNKVWDCLMSARLSGSTKFQRQSSTSSTNSMVSVHDIVVDIVMDNAGFELFSDLCLADFLITTGLASVVRLRVKVHPWFVSDTSQKDIDWLLDQMCNGAMQYRHTDGDTKLLGSKQFDKRTKPTFSSRDQDAMSKMKKLGEKWKSYLLMGSLTIHSDPFWTYPHVYRYVSFLLSCWRGAFTCVLTCVFTCCVFTWVLACELTYALT